MNKIKHLEECNPKEFWKLVNSIKSQRSNNSNEISSNEWFKYFSTLNNIKFPSKNSEIESQIVKDYHLWAKTSDTQLDQPISLGEIKEASKKLKNKKASANDSISNEIIKTSCISLGPFYMKIFNSILSKGVFPETMVRRSYYAYS